MNYEEIEKISQECVGDPQPGDYWHEMFSPVCVVVERLRDHVVICKKKQQDDEGWMWDFSKLEVMQIVEFKKWLSYNTENLRGKLWADCNKGSHKNIIKAFLEKNDEDHQ